MKVVVELEVIVMAVVMIKGVVISDGDGGDMVVVAMVVCIGRVLHVLVVLVVITVFVRVAFVGELLLSGCCVMVIGGVVVGVVMLVGFLVMVGKWWC